MLLRLHILSKQNCIVNEISFKYPQYFAALNGELLFYLCVVLFDLFLSVLWNRERQPVERKGEIKHVYSSLNPLRNESR